MSEIKMPKFNLDALTPIETKNFEKVCSKHGPYIQKVMIYRNGSCIPENYCPECEKLDLEAFKQKEIEKEKQHHISLCQKCNIEPEYYDKTIKDYEGNTKTQREAKEAVIKMMNGELNKLVLLGGNGTGKTMLGSILAKHFNYCGKIYSMYEITTMIRQSYTIKAEKTELEIVQELASIPFLAIDEMGRTKGSDSEKNWLSYILDKRHTRNLPFLLISNGHLRRNCTCKDGCEKCFENYMDLDVISRLRQNSEIITINGPDFRAKN